MYANYAQSRITRIKTIIKACGIIRVMNIKPWLDECCEMSGESQIRPLWASFRKWLERQPDAAPYLADGWWPRQGQLRDELLRSVCQRGGYKNAPTIIGVRLRET